MIEPDLDDDEPEIAHGYLVELFVGPGGSRKADCFLTPDIDAARRHIDADLRESLSIYLMVAYGHSVTITAFSGPVIDGVIHADTSDVVTVHDHVVIRARGYSEIRFDADTNPIGYDIDDDLEAHDGDEEATLADRAFNDQLAPGDVTVEILWDELELPALEGRPLHEPAHVPSQYARRSCTFLLGLSSLE